MARNTITTRTGLFTSGSDYATLGLIGFVASIGALVWGTGQLAGLLFRGVWPEVSFGDAFQIAVALPGHLGDPRQAWPAAVRHDLPGPAGVYTAALLLAAAMIVAVTIGARMAARGRSEHGFATRAQLTAALSPKAALAKAARLRPDLPPKKARISDVAVDLGRATPSGMRLAATIQNSVAVFAAPQTGKTSQVVIPWLTGWAGPAVVTSVRGDIIENTLPLRAARGPVAIIDFAEENWPHRLRWSPLTGCGDYDKARQRAGVLVQVGKDTSDSTNAGFFGLSASNLLAGWLHTAAVTGKTMNEVLGWALREGPLCQTDVRHSEQVVWCAK